MKVRTLTLLALMTLPTLAMAGEKICTAQIRVVEHQVIQEGQKEAINKQAEEHDAEHFRRMLERCTDASQSVKSVWTAALAKVEGKGKK